MFNEEQKNLTIGQIEEMKESLIQEIKGRIKEFTVRTGLNIDGYLSAYISNVDTDNGNVTKTDTNVDIRIKEF